MKHNAFTTGPVRLYLIWGSDLAPYVDLPDGTPVFVLWSPTLKQWIASITHIDYRYDALLSTSNFRLDASLLPTDGPEPADTYYLHKIVFQNS